MSKSISKKILIFLFVAVAALCVCLPCTSWLNAKAEKVEYEQSGQTVDSSTDIESRIAELTEGIEFYKNAIPSDIVVVDTNDEALTKMQVAARTQFEYANYNYVSGSLYGDYGLNGLLGIYEVAYEFYAEYIFIDPRDEVPLTTVGEANLLAPSVDKILIEKATEYIKTCTSEQFKNDPAEGAESLPYKKNRVDSWLQAFVNDQNSGLAYVLSIESDLELFREQRFNRLDYVCAYYFSDKYDVTYVNSEVYQSQTDVSEEQLNQVKAEITAIFDTETDFARAKRLMQEKVDGYEALFADLETSLQRAYNEVHAKSSLNAENAADANQLIEECENAFQLFESLGTIDGFLMGTDGEFHAETIDLKSGNIVGQDNDSLGDLKVALNLMTEYKALVKRAISEADSLLKLDYGVSSEKVTSDYVNYAKGLADSLTGYFGKLTPSGETAPVTATGYSATQYTYKNASGTNVRVVCGSDIVQAFKDSPFCNGALTVTYNGDVKKSTALDEFKKKSTVVDDKSSEDYVVYITCVDNDGNEIEYFNSDATLVAREGASASVERNLYLILKGDRLEEGTKGLSEETIKYLNGRVLKYYFTFTISSSTIKDGKLSVLEFDEPLTVVIKIKFNKAEDFEAIKDKTCALDYCHANVNTVYSDIEWGDSTMTFKVSNFANQAQFAMATEGEASFDWALYIILGLVGLVALLFLIWIIVSIIRNWKYKIIFNANGGKYNSCIKVKLHEKFNHPNPPYRKGYKFLGWFADSKCTVRFAASELTKRGKIKVYAKWMSDEEYEKLNEQYVGATSTSINTVWMDPSVGVRKDPSLEKIEAEKLSYEAKKAEEERKKEEIKLQAIREIDEAKKNDEARLRAEQEADEAKVSLKKSQDDLADIIKKERADERAKCIEEMSSAHVENEVDYEAAIAKAKEETEEKLRKEFDEESKLRAEEQAKINAELLEKIKALEEANAKAEEEAKKRAEDEARRLAEEEAKKQAENLAFEAKTEEPVVEFDTEHVFDELKAEIYSYDDADDLGYGLEAIVPACAMKVVDKTIELEVNLDVEDCAKKGYKVVAGEKLPVKFVLANDDDIDEAEELIEEAMLVNGLKKTQKAVVTASTEETRVLGFEHGVSKDKVADTAEEFYKLMRVHAKSFVLADDSDVEEKLLMKMFLRRGKVYLYLNHSAEGLKACDDEMAVVGLKTFMTVKNVEDCKEAIKLISAMMKENGLIRYPSEVKMAEEDCLKGFTYTLSK